MGLQTSHDHSDANSNTSLCIGRQAEALSRKHHAHLARHHQAPHNHRDNHRHRVPVRKLFPRDVHVLLRKEMFPEQAGERGWESVAISTAFPSI